MGRADWALELQLEHTKAQAVAAEAREAVEDVLRYLRSGGRGRRGGRELLRRLEIARLRASEESEWHVVRLVQDAHDYSSGRTTKPEFEERFQLFQDGARTSHNREMLAGIFHAVSSFVGGVGQRLLDEHDGCSAEHLLSHLKSLMSDGKFVDAPEDRPGRYRIVRGRAELALWLERVLRNRVDVEDPAAAAHELVRRPEALMVLGEEDGAEFLFKAAELRRRSAALTKLRTLVEDPATTETDLQWAIERQPWLFGGEYVETSTRRRLVAGNEMDIPLLRADGSLHVVELKCAMGARRIIKQHRGTWVPAAEVHDAAAQAVNYLVGLDEHRSAIRSATGIETRRSTATVLIGHPEIHPDVPEEVINDVFRTLNAHMNRVEVLTYKEFLDGAERALCVSPPPRDVP